MNAPLRTAPVLEQDTVPHDDDDAFSLVDVLLFVVDHWKALTLAPLAAGIVALGVAFMIPITFTATTRILPPQHGGGATMLMASQLGALAGIAGAAAGIKNPAEQYVSLIRSRSIADRLIERFDLTERYESRKVDDTRKRLSQTMSVSAGTKDGIITIEVEDTDPIFAAKMANAAVDEARQLSKRLALTEASQRRLFFETQLQTARKELDHAEASLRASGVSETTLRAEPRAAVEEVARLKAAVTMAELRVASLSGFMAPNNPDLKQARQELGALRAQLARVEQGSVATEGRGSEYIARYREYKYHEMLFELMAKQYELARLDEARDSGTVQVIDSAVAPDRKSGPKRGIIAIATTLVAFVLVLAALILRRTFQRDVAERASPEQLLRLSRLVLFRKAVRRQPS